MNKIQTAYNFNVNPDLFDSAEEIEKFAQWFSYSKPKHS